MPGDYTKVVYTPAGHIVFIEKQLKESVPVLFYFQNRVKRNLVKKNDDAPNTSVNTYTFHLYATGRFPQ
jgi:hypothetical protein